MIREKLQEEIRQLRIVREPSLDQKKQLGQLEEVLANFDNKRQSLLNEYSGKVEFRRKYQDAIFEVSMQGNQTGVVDIDTLV
jgi:hypothetical protein